VAAQPPSDQTLVVLTNVTVEAFDAFDRATFVFQEEVPGFRVVYLEPWMASQVEIEGRAVLSILMAPGSQDASARATYFQGPVEFPHDLGAIVDAEHAAEFEGAVTWRIGLTSRSNFQVQTLDDPPRLTVDVAHP